MNRPILFLLGPAARGKGLALFPRLVNGAHVALSRWDGAGISITVSPAACPMELLMDLKLSKSINNMEARL